jgi:hypothetical protein
VCATAKRRAATSAAHSRRRGAERNNFERVRDNFKLERNNIKVERNDLELDRDSFFGARNARMPGHLRPIQQR